MSEEELAATIEAAIERADDELRTDLETIHDRVLALQTAAETARAEKRVLLDELEATNRGTLRLTAELEAQYRRLFETAVEGIHQTSPAVDTYTVANPALAQILGYQSVDALYEGVSSLETDVFVDPEQYADYRTRLQTTGRLDDFEYQVRRADGEIRWVSEYTTDLRDQDGTLEGYQGGIIDITDRKEREERLQDQRDKLDVVNQIIRHDIRNDMSIILGWARLLEDETPGIREDAVGRIIETGEHVVSITEVIRDFVEMLVDESASERTTIDLRTILVHEIEAQRVAHPEANFAYRAPAGSIPVRGTQTINSVFQNLLRNAVQHNDKDTPEVTIDVETDPGQVTVRIADNGPGIPSQRRERLFDKHEKGQTSTGTGLGLYLVDVLVTQCDGSVWVEENHPEGSVFGVEFETVGGRAAETPSSDGSGSSDESRCGSLGDGVHEP